MTPFIRRPDAVFDPGAGLLRADHFQMAYATNDLDQACDFFSQRLGISAYGEIGGAMPSGGQIKVRVAWVGTIMYEIMWAQGPGSAIYMDRLPAGEGFALKHHHLGYMVHDQQQWDALMETIRRGGWAMPYHNNNPGLLQSCFIDVPQLGHYLEYIFPEAAGIAFFEKVPGHG